MEKFKICPNCGERNPSELVECIKCEYDLTSVSEGEIYIKEDEKASDSSCESQNEGIKRVRICSCGRKNAFAARKCSCGEDISDIIPSIDGEQDISGKKHFILSSIDGKYEYEIVSNMIIVGRENTMKEYLAAKEYVSRKHAEFLVEGDKVYIKNHSITNHTFVNNERINDGEFVELHDGDIIGLGGKEINGTFQEKAAFFRMRM